VATDFDWAGFRALAKRLDDLVGGSAGGSAVASAGGSAGDDSEFAENLRRALTFVYTAGITMPSAGDIFEDAGGDEFWNGTPAVSGSEDGDEASSETIEALAERIVGSVEAVQPDELGDPEEVAQVAAVAAENILDVLLRLGDGNNLFDERRLQEAQWEWSFGFDEWGAQALAGLSALHELLWGAR
jgi:hypothetical protein